VLTETMNDSALTPSTAELFRRLGALVDAILAGSEHDEHLAELLDYVRAQREVARSVQPGETP